MQALGHIAGPPADGYAPARARAAAPELREYQVRAIDELRRKVVSGRRRVVLCLACGGGKTLVSAEIVRRSVANGRRVVFVAHRRELIKQAHEKFARFGIDAGIIMGSSAGRDDWLPVQICSVATLARRMDRLPPASLVVIDEVHHCMAQSYLDVMDAYANATILGLTATPWRSDKKGLADVFDDHVVVATVADLMKQGHLVGYDAFAYDSPKLHKVKITAGDFNAKQLDLACNTGVLVGNIVKEWLAHANRRPTIVFPVSIAHSQAIIAEFAAAGVTGAHVDCHMPGGERDEALRRFADGEITVLSSVGILGEGWDAPLAEVVILARPTKSLSLYMQQVGRGLRPSPATGKTRCLIHDHAGNMMRHGLVDEDRSYDLRATPKSERDMLTCPLCMAVFGSVTVEGRCPKCGEAIAPKAMPREGGERSDVLVVDGQRIGKDEIQRMRAERAGKGVEDRGLSDEDIARGARATTDQKIAELKRLQNVQREKGLKAGFVYHQYRRAFGVAPGNFEAADLARVPAATKSFIPYKRTR